ncbi:MAG: dTMP kinase [Dehalococcoidia bacterium]|nr:dTMP kinase [Dehalococcoidia bacterium]
MPSTKPPEQGSGVFITIEGGDGAGKTTQATLLQRRLEAAGRKVVLTRDPGGTPVGEEIRGVLLSAARKEGEGHSPSSLAPQTEALLFEASRAQLVRDVIRPALERGEIVVCDRYSDSTLAYQGYGRGLDIEALEAADRLATGGLKPHLSVFLDLRVETALGRKGEREEQDHVGGQSRAFHERVRRGFADLAAKEPRRWLIVDAALPVEAVADLIWERVQSLLEPGG